MERQKRYYLKQITGDGLVKDIADNWGDRKYADGFATKEAAWDALERTSIGYGASAFVFCEWVVDDNSWMDRLG
jgi:hypothetical protein